MTDIPSKTSTSDDSPLQDTSFWASNVIPGLTVQVIDPMPPVQDPDHSDASDAECRSARSPLRKLRAGKSLSKLSPRNGERANRRRKRLLKLRDQQSGKTSASPVNILPNVGRPVEECAGQSVVDENLFAPDTQPSSPPRVKPFRKSPRRPKQTDFRTAGAVTSPLVQDELNASDEVVQINRDVLAGHASAEPEPIELPSELSAPEPQSRVLRRQAQGRRRKSRSARLSSQDADDDENELYADWFRRVILQNRWMSLFTTFYVHWLVLLVLAAILVHGPENAAAFILDATFDSELPVETEPFDVTMPDLQPVEEREQQQEEETQEDSEPVRWQESTTTIADSVLDQMLKDLPEQPQNSGVPSAAKDSAAEKSSNARSPGPAPARAVSNGSFSVWTEPASPQAGESYRIVIQVCLPPGLERYNVRDLQGVVVGSDGYKKPIPGFLKGFLPIESGYARLIVPIVSADEHVRDTIFIRSRILKENQKLLIDFEPEG